MNFELSQQKQWDKYYSIKKQNNYLPKPEKYRGDFELDKIFKQFLRKDNNIRLLELGVGASMWLGYFAKEFGYKVYGIDYSKQGCLMAKENIKKAGVEGKIYYGDFLKDFDHLKNYFNIIISFGVIEHFQSPLEIINVMKKFLSQNGLIINILPNTVSHIFHLQKFIDRAIYNSHNILSIEDYASYHIDADLKISFKYYLNFLNLGILNFQNVFKSSTYKWIARIITGLNLPFYYFQKIFNIYPQSKKGCSSIIIIARKT